MMWLKTIKPIITIALLPSPNPVTLYLAFISIKEMHITNISHLSLTRCIHESIMYIKAFMELVLSENVLFRQSLIS